MDPQFNFLLTEQDNSPSILWSLDRHWHYQVFFVVRLFVCLFVCLFACFSFFTRSSKLGTLQREIDGIWWWFFFSERAWSINFILVQPGYPVFLTVTTSNFFADHMDWRLWGRGWKNFNSFPYLESSFLTAQARRPWVRGWLQLGKVRGMRSSRHANFF